MKAAVKGEREILRLEVHGEVNLVAFYRERKSRVRKILTDRYIFLSVCCLMTYHIIEPGMRGVKDSLQLVL